MTKLLFDLQISSFDSNQKPLIGSDSNYLFTQGIVAGLREFGFDTFIDTLGGYRHPEKDRYYWHPDTEVDIVRNIRPDIIWTNDPCKVGNYRTFWNKPLICYNHWIDTPDSPKMEPDKTYFWRQLEAMFKADLYLVNSQSGIDTVRKSLEVITDKAIESYHISRISAVNPPLMTDDIRSAIDSAHIASKPTIVFNHRLSSLEQYDTNTHHLLSLMNKLNVVLGEDKYQVYVSNPSGKNHSILSRPNVVNIYNQNYYEYLKKIAEGWFQVNFFEYDGQWSMAMAEALCLGLDVIYPGHHGYKEMAGLYGIACDPFGYIDIDFVVEYIQGRDFFTRNWHQAEHFLKTMSSSHIVETQLLPLLAEYI